MNGEPIAFFPSERGLGQGDPLSPFLFILAMEGLNSTVRVATQKNWLKGLKVGNQAGVDVQICHLLYADDTMIFCEAKEEQVCFIRINLIVLEAVSGLFVNWKFLLNILKQMVFGEKWLKWIEFCIKIARFSILVNGEPIGFFPSERGLRQGDPFSPFLFISED